MTMLGRRRPPVEVAILQTAPLNEDKDRDRYKETSRKSEFFGESSFIVKHAMKEMNIHNDEGIPGEVNERRPQCTSLRRTDRLHLPQPGWQFTSIFLELALKLFHKKVLETLKRSSCKFVLK